MALRSPIFFAGAFLLLAVTYLAYFNVTMRTDPDAAQSRFQILVDANAPRRAAPHGERALAMRVKAGEGAETLAPFKAQIATAQIKRGNYGRGVELLTEALSSDWARDLNIRDHIELQDQRARAEILADQLEDAVAVYASFIELAGDAASRGGAESADSLDAFYANQITEVRPLFTETLNHATAYEPDAVGPEAQLATASQMAALGSFYAMQEGGDYAAAGLLSAAYQIRKGVLGGDHQDTVQLTLILGPGLYRYGPPR